MNKKTAFLLTPIALLSLSCNLFGKATPSGIVKTVNGGIDWQFSNVIKDSKTTMVADNIAKLGFDRANRQVVYAGTYNDGLYRSENAGASWTRILPAKIYVYDFAISPVDSKIIYVAGFAGDHGSVVFSSDAGVTWQEIYKDQNTNNPAAVRSIAINPNQPSQIIIGTETGSVIKSSDSGLSWRLIKDYKSRINRILWQYNNVYVLARNAGLYKSIDSGETFSSLTDSVFGSGITGFITNTSIDSFNQVFVDLLSQNLMYLTTSKGLYKSTDEGKTWTLVKLPLSGDQILVRSIAIAKNNSNIVYTSVGATIYKSLDGGNTWQTQGINTTGYVSFILIDPDLPQIAYAGIYVNQ